MYPMLGGTLAPYTWHAIRAKKPVNSILNMEFGLACMPSLLGIGIKPILGRKSLACMPSFQGMRIKLLRLDLAME